MALSKVEKICRVTRAKSRSTTRHLKRLTSKAWRRAARRDPENAPTRLRDITRGWSD